MLKNGGLYTVLEKFISASTILLGLIMVGRATFILLLSLISNLIRNNEHENIKFKQQIKKCGEMSRKLRYFKDQMSKAGLTPTLKTESQGDINMDDLERDNTGIGGSWSEFLEYLKFGDVKLVLDGKSKSDGHSCYGCYVGHVDVQLSISPSYSKSLDFIEPGWYKCCIRKHDRG